MKQRALIATALACAPELLVLDEPTTALDVTIEAQILDLLEKLRRDRGLSMLYITHNLGVVARICDDVCVLYAGRVVEQGATEAVLRQPRHPYTKGLLASLPRVAQRRHRLVPIPGRFPDLRQPPSGCIFHPRCSFVQDRCRSEPQVLADGVRCWRAAELAGERWRTDEDATPPRAAARKRRCAGGREGPQQDVPARRPVRRHAAGLVGRLPAQVRAAEGARSGRRLAVRMAGGSAGPGG
jgi:peptide/nickel transport system ATP-binding protein